MAASQGYPKWLLNCKDNIGESKEWNVFLHELHDAVQQQLTESHVQYFTDLSEAEKELFIQRATKAIEGGSVYNGLQKKVGVLLDQNLNEEVSRQLLDEAPYGTKSDLVLDCAEEGSLSLLKKWPDMKSKLHYCLNQPLPIAMRLVAWRLYLTNTKVRKQYIDILSANPRSAISPYDKEISDKCAQYLDGERTLVDLRGSQGMFYGMKAVLSYYHSTLKTKARLKDVEYLLMVPILQVNSASISRREPPGSKVVALLVEEFFSYMESRPGFVMDSGTEAHDEEMKGFVDKVAKLLQRYYPEVPRMIIEKFVPSKERIVATEAGGFAVLKDGVMQLVRPMIRSMFVTYLRMDVLLYVWDQYVMGLDTPGFNPEWLAIVTAIILGLLKERLRESESAQRMEMTLRLEGPKITIPQLQYEMTKDLDEVKRNHYKDLYALLQKDFKSAMPVLDPTQAIHPPWRHWYNDVIPPYTRPQDRRKAREEREAERERLSQQARDADYVRREHEARARREEEEEYLKLAAADKARVEQERIALEEQLEQERRNRLEAEKKAKEQIEQLQLEVNYLKEQKPPTRPASEYSVSSYISRVLVAPPPSIASRATTAQPVVMPARTPTPAIPQQDQTQMVMVDFLRKIAAAMNTISHAEGAEKHELDRQTDGFLHQNIRDIKQAQMDIFGYKLQPGEFDRMSPGKQQDTSDKMMSLIQTWREERRAEELKKKKK